MTDSNGRTVRLRRQDKEHLSPEGNRLVVQLLLPAIERHIAAFREQNPHKLLTEQERSRTRNAQLENTIKLNNRRR